MDSNSIAWAFRRFGYLQAELDSFNRIPKIPHPELDTPKSDEAKKWRELYCGPIGLELGHIHLADRCAWLIEKFENSSKEIFDKKAVLRRLISADTFEHFLHTRYIGSKRFSLEGHSALIPLLDTILSNAAEAGFETVLIGISHRGRLNTMLHIVGTSPEKVFAGFEDVDPESAFGSSDVKYHWGATGTYETASGKSLRVHLASNPSHLEAINPVVLGRVRAKQVRAGDSVGKKVLCITLHGDAAFAGQGIAAETLNFAELPGFDIGGTVHIVVNNLIGFTATPKSFLSSNFASDIAKRLPVPIFHVNGEVPEAVVRAGRIATEYRSAFSSDVVIDLIAYRRYGHSEVDDPTLTSPVLYEEIQSRPALYKRYADQIGVTDSEVQSIIDEITKSLAVAFESAKTTKKKPVFANLPSYWDGYFGGAYNSEIEVNTQVPQDRLITIAEKLNAFPSGFTVHPKLKKGIEERLRMAEGKKPIDWGTAEAFAFGSLLWDGTPVRVVGQDSRRGTFNHRQAVLVDVKTGAEFTALQNLHPGQAWFEIYDSMLSEAAALGYEYGFSRDYPEALVCWEAQFGDFANGAQIIIDQFISAGEDKWGLLSGLVMLLPHGFEGQGPEHSSARIERYLQLCAEDNMQVCYPSTSGQYFHLLRRQALRKWRKPLVVFTPKSMLRALPACSSIEVLTSGKFEPVLNDTEYFPEATTLLLCSGKIAHELRAERKLRNDTSKAIVTIEQLFPFPEFEIESTMGLYPNADTIIWVQEEPGNMGALFFVLPHLKRICGHREIRSVKRAASASPSTGSAKAHELEQQAIIKLAFADYS